MKTSTGHQINQPVDAFAERRERKAMDQRFGPEDCYRLPNGCDLRPGCRVRVPAKDIWRIPEADINHYGLCLEHDAASPGSEVISMPAGPPRPALETCSQQSVEIAAPLHRMVPLAAKDGNPIPPCDPPGPRSLRLDRGSQPITSPRHDSDYRAEMEHGRIGASSLHREPVSPVVVLLLILCAVLCLAAILSGPRGVLMVLVFAGTVFGIGGLLGWALARWA